jgi:hypothetical protein
MMFTGGSPVFTTLGTNYTVPVGWNDIEPPIFGRNPMACIVANGTSPVTFNPTWPAVAAFTATSILATFKTFPATAINASFWSIVPGLPFHTRQFGIDPLAPDNRQPFIAFGRYLNSIVPASGSFHDERDNTPVANPVLITIANPAVVTVDTNVVSDLGNLGAIICNSKAVSFTTTGSLPTGITAGQRYYIQYGTITRSGTIFTFQISTTSIFLDNTNGGFQTSVKGVPIATTGTQSGTHSIAFYGDSWTDIVLDPGVYWATQNQIPGMGVGLRRWRLLGYGARMATQFFFGGVPWYDLNAATGGTTNAFSSKFQSVNTDPGHFPDFITLVTPSEAVNFNINSWVGLMALDQIGSSSGNWSPALFEFLKIKTIDVATGIITFWSPLQYAYRATFPKFLAPAGAFVNSSLGPATIVQLTDVFDQQMECHGLNIYATGQAVAGGVVSVKFVDCEIFSAGGKTGPTPVAVRDFTMERCIIHNAAIEVDKMIDMVRYVDCVFDGTAALLLQSTSINKMIVERCRLPGFGGTARDLTLRDCYISGSLTFGPVYGMTERVTLINSHIEKVEESQGEQEFALVDDTTFVNGTLKIAVNGGTTFQWKGTSVPSGNPFPAAIPGAKININLWGVTTGGTLLPNTPTGAIQCFTVLDVYTDGSDNYCIDTTLQALPDTAISVTGTVAGTTLTVTAITPSDAAILRGMRITGGSLPAGTTIATDLGIPNASSNLGAYTLSNSATIGTPTNFNVTIPMNYLPHSCPSLTIANCTGGRFVTEQAGAPPNLPIYSYFKRGFAGFSLASTRGEQYVYLVGNLLTWQINVQKPYTGLDATYTLTIYMCGFKTSGGKTYSTWTSQVVNLKTAGIRTITPTAVTGSVAGDTLAALPWWLSGGHFIVTSNANAGDNLSNMPVYVMTAQTDQQITPAMTVNTVKSGPTSISDSVSGTTMF